MLLSSIDIQFVINLPSILVSLHTKGQIGRESLREESVLWVHSPRDPSRRRTQRMCSKLQDRGGGSTGAEMEHFVV
jgi:hypothetical protein